MLKYKCRKCGAIVEPSGQNLCQCGGYLEIYNPKDDKQTELKEWQRPFPK